MSDSENETLTDLSSAPVVEKHMVISGFVNETLQILIDACVPGKNVFELCQLGDKTLEEKCAKVYNKPKTDKGLAFPTCISLNEICGHYSPMDDAEKVVLKEGDLVKIDLGGHIDGFCAVAAHSVLLPGGDEAERQRKSDAIHAAWNSQECAIRMLKDGIANKEVTSVMAKACAEFECEPMQGVLSHQMKQHVISANKCIINKEMPDQKVELHHVNVNEVWTIDSMVSTGEGKPRESEERTTIFKRDLELNHQLKTNKARQFISEVSQRYPTMPFCLRNFEDKVTAKLGVKEALLHGLFDPYPVLREKQGEYVAQFKCTMLMLGGGAKKVAGLPFNQEDVKTDKCIKDQELKNLLLKSMDKKKKKKKPAAKKSE